jgi:dTDP-glucose 4,6-dehydratase
VTWYETQRPWWSAIKSGEYKNYYAKMYGSRLRGSDPV